MNPFDIIDNIKRLASDTAKAQLDPIELAIRRRTEHVYDTIKHSRREHGIETVYNLFMEYKEMSDRIDELETMLYEESMDNELEE